MIETTRTPVQNCLRCGEKLDAATALEEGIVPGPGDITVCFYCQAVMQFNDDLSLRWADAETIAEVAFELSVVQNKIKHKDEVQ